MKLKTFEAETMAQALAQVKREMGADAVILRTRTMTRGSGLLKLRKRQMVEITASNDISIVPPKMRRQVLSDSMADHMGGRSNAPAASHGPVASATAGGTALQRAYAQSSATAVADPPGGGRYAPSRDADRPAGRLEPVNSPSRSIASRSEIADPVLRSVLEGRPAPARRSEPEAVAVPARPEPVPAVAAAASASSVSSRLGTLPRPTTLASISQTSTAMSEEVKEIRQMVHRMMKQQATNQRGDLTDTLFRQYLSLLEQEVAEEIADDVITRARKKLVGANRDREEVVRKELQKQIGQLLPAAGADAPRPGRMGPRVIALVGPTGVGKTTTVAKLAANFKLREGKRVALITIDTYRIAAVDQLRTYAQIIDVPLHVVMTPEDMSDAIAACADCDVILIDTAGRGQRDEQKLSELTRFMEAAGADEVHLVLSSAAGEKVLLEAAERFACMKVDRILFTKLDEAVTFGVILNVVRKVNKQLSYVTTGQDVPNHIEASDPERIAALILGGEV